MAKAAEKVRQLIHQPAGPNIPAGASRSFIQLVKAIGEAGSNHEEDRVIRKEAKVLAAKMKETNINPRQMKEYLVRLMYCEMLGHEAEFGYIHAVKLAQHASILEKRIGYLAVSVLLHEEHELMLLLTNTLQRDLKSTNVVEICTALTTISRVMNSEMIPAVLPLVEEKCSHKREIVRKKAILALHRFYSRNPSSIGHLIDKIKNALCDKDPGVMAASLNIFFDLARGNPSDYKDLVPTFVSILKQIIERRLPKDFDYHKVPAPWMQVKLLKLMGMLGANDQSASEGMYEVIRDCLQRAETQGSAAYAVVYECLGTITKMYPSPELVEMAANSIGRFLTAENNNLKYLGITALVAVVQVNPAYAADHQLVVIDCLDDPDETLKRKTLELLCKMTNPVNVTVITEKLVAYTKNSVDPYLRKDLVPRIVQLAERFAPDNQWFLETMITLLEYAGDLVHKDTLNNLLSLIANPDSGDDAADAELRLFAFESFMELLTKPKLADKLIQAVCWVCGEYAYLADEYDKAAVIEEIVSLLNRPFENKNETTGWVLTCLLKLSSQTGLYPDVLRVKVEALQKSKCVDTQQRCLEILRLREQPAVMARVLPLDSSSEDMEVDNSLSFLNAYVSNALANGADAYIPREERESTLVPEAVEEEVEAPAMKFDAYEAPQKADIHSSLFAGVGNRETNEQTSAAPGGLSSLPEAENSSTKESAPAATLPKAGLGGISSGPRRWGKGGDKLKKATPPAAAASAVEVNMSAAPTTTSENTPSLVEPEVPAESAAEPAPNPAMETVKEPYAPSPEVQRKKELAAQLFGAPASSSHTSRVRGSKFKKKGGTSTSSTAAPVAAPQTSSNGGSGGDLLGDLFSLDISAPTPAAVAPAATSSALDILAPPPPSYQAATSASAGDLLGGGGDGGDLLGDLFSAPTSSSSAVQVSAAAPASLMDGDLLSMGGPSSGGDLMSMFSGGSSTGLMEDPTKLPSSLTSFPHEMYPSPISTDPSISVTHAKVWKPVGMVVVLFYKNVSQSPIQGISTSIDAPSHLRPLDGSPSTFILNLGPGETGQQVLQYTSQSVSAGTSIKGTFSYNGGLTPAKGFFKISVVARDLIRSCKITTEEFGANWEGAGMAAAHRTQTITSPAFKSADSFISALADKLHLHPVEVIGVEVILCGQILLNPTTKCLVHGKVKAASIEISVRSTNAQYSQAVITQCAAICQGK